MVVIVVSPSTSVKTTETTDAATTTVSAADEHVPVAPDSPADSPADSLLADSPADSLGRRNLRVGVHATPLHTPRPDAIVAAVLGRRTTNDQKKTHARTPSNVNNHKLVRSSSCVRIDKCLHNKVARHSKSG